MNLAFPVQKVLSQKNFLQWYTGGDEYNLALGATGGAAGVTVGLGAASVLCFTVVFFQWLLLLEYMVVESNGRN